MDGVSMLRILLQADRQKDSNVSTEVYTDPPTPD